MPANFSPRRALRPVIAWLASIILLTGSANGIAEAPKRVFEEKPLEVVDTGLQFMTGVNPGGPGFPFNVHWLDNDFFIVNALQDVPNANVVEAERTMRVDARTGKSTQIVEQGWVLRGFNQVRGIGSIRPTPFKPTLPYGPRKDDVQYRFVRIDRQGHVSSPIEVSDMDPVTCASLDMKPPANSVAHTLREGDGYLMLIRPGMRASTNDMAVWIRPGKPDIELHVLREEIHPMRGAFLEFSQKYLLNSRDSQGNSGTDRRLGGAGWKRPYDLTPYRLLSLDGSVEEIPYPKIIFEYGLKGFGRLVPTPVGLLISAHNSLFLLNGEQMTRIWGKPGGWLFANREYAYNVRLSPNGCKAVFGRVPDWNPETWKPISIITLCKGE